MGNYIILEMFENPRIYNKCSENSRSQIVSRTDIFRKVAVGCPYESEE